MRPDRGLQNSPQILVTQGAVVGEKMQTVDPSCRVFGGVTVGLCNSWGQATFDLTCSSFGSSNIVAPANARHSFFAAHV